MAEPEIREGFLCPMCMKDLGGVADLQDHFEVAHSNEDKAVLQQLKGLFGKAKRKILGKEREDGAMGGFGPQEGSDSSHSPTMVDVGGIDPTMWEPQEVGAWRSYTDAFKKVRDQRIDRFVVETNKLLIRLDKLISSEVPMDPGKRKAYEKTIVPWAPDSDVNLCTSCGKSFTITRRRHHCRLCGGIICNRCSQFMPYTYAKKLTDPAFHYEGEGFHRSNSNSSLNSIMSPEGEMHIRTCRECRVLLERRDMQVEQRNTKPVVGQLYDKMKTYMDEAEQALPTFLQMAESLNAGETMYSYAEAQRVRIRVMRLYESIDQISKRIAKMGLDAADPPGPRQLFLQRSIRIHASGFMQENMLGLQSLPPEQELAARREAKRLEVQRRIEAERRAAVEKEQRRKEEEQRKSSSSPTKVASAAGSGNGTPVDRRVEARRPTQLKEGVTAVGWKPTEVNNQVAGGEADDPLVQQMNIIRSYIKQAKQAGKWDEVKIFEDNLKELQAEYWRQQQTVAQRSPQQES